MEDKLKTFFKDNKEIFVGTHFYSENFSQQNVKYSYKSQFSINEVVSYSYLHNKGLINKEDIDYYYEKFRNYEEKYIYNDKKTTEIVLRHENMSIHLTNVKDPELLDMDVTSKDFKDKVFEKLENGSIVSYCYMTMNISYIDSDKITVTRELREVKNHLITNEKFKKECSIKIVTTRRVYCKILYTHGGSINFIEEIKGSNGEKIYKIVFKTNLENNHTIVGGNDDNISKYFSEDSKNINDFRIPDYGFLEGFAKFISRSLEFINSISKK